MMTVDRHDRALYHFIGLVERGLCVGDAEREVEKIWPDVDIEKYARTPWTRQDDDGDQAVSKRGLWLLELDNGVQALVWAEAAAGAIEKVRSDDSSWSNERIKSAKVLLTFDQAWWDRSKSCVGFGRVGIACE